jgi:hypothetical protein
MCKVQISVGKNQNKNDDSQKFVWTDRKHAVVLKVYITILHQAYQLSVYKLTVLRVIVETTSTTPLTYLNSL